MTAQDKADRDAREIEIDLNSDPINALRMLPRMGPKRARAIMTARFATPFASWADIADRVEGVGDGLVKRWREAGAVLRDAQPSNVVPFPSAARESTETASGDAGDTIQAPEGWEWTQGQREAIKAIRAHLRSRRGEVFVLRGFAGTGKTTLLIEALRPFAAPLLVAPTHKAASILAPKADLLGGEVGTVHRWLGYRCRTCPETGEDVFERAPRRDDYDPQPLRPVVIDEVSMIGEDMWGEILGEVADHGLACIAMGDPLQLPPVGEVSSPAFGVAESVELTEVKRSAGVLCDVVLGVRERIFEHTPPTLSRSLRDARGCVDWFGDRSNFIADIVGAFREGRDAMVLAWRNRVVEWLNSNIRGALVGWDSAPFEPGEVLTLTKPYAVSDERQSVLRRKASIGMASAARRLCTESRVLVVDAEPGTHPAWGEACWVLTCKPLGFAASAGAQPLSDHDKIFGLVKIYALDKAGRERHKRVMREKREALKVARQAGDRQWVRQVAYEISDWRAAFAYLRPGYATTVHKSQGSTWAEVYAIQGDISGNPEPFERNRLLYVAFSRAARRLAVYGG